MIYVCPDLGTNLGGGVQTVGGCQQFAQKFAQKTIEECGGLGHVRP